MSQKPVDLNRAIETLRKETSPADAKARLDMSKRLNVRRPQRLGRYFAFAGAAVVLAVILWPRQTSSAAWARIAGQTAAAEKMHLVTRNAKGQVAQEQWYDGTRQAYVLWLKDGSVMCEEHFDGNRMFTYIRPLGTASPLPNARRIATVSSRRPLFFQRPYQDIKKTLSDYQGTALSTDRIEGGLDRYRVQFKNGKDLIVNLIDVDPKMNHIMHWRPEKGGYDTVIDYPDTIDAKFFAPVPQVATGIEVVDLDQERIRLQGVVTRGVARKGAITLRLAALDRRGSLWVFWTGSTVDGRLSHPYRLLRVKSGPPYGLQGFTTSRRMAATLFGVPNVYGHSREILDPIGSRATLEIPTTKGYVRFENVPITRVVEATYYGVDAGWFIRRKS